MSAAVAGDSRTFEPLAQGWRSFAWSSGRFDAAVRPPTREVEGRISLHHPTVIAMIDGGCRHLEITSECGHRYQGADFAGSVSFLPQGCGREIKMRDVRSEWVSLSIRPDLFRLSEDAVASPSDVATFTNQRDAFLHAALTELLRLHKGDGLDGLYCESLSQMVAHYLARRYGTPDRAPRPESALPGWRLRRVTDYIQTNLSDPELRLDDLAQCIGLSTGFFHRAFKETTGETPLTYIQRLRIQRSMQLLVDHDLSVLQVALRVGFLSPGHFSRLFQQQVGMTPSQYRKGRR